MNTDEYTCDNNNPIELGGGGFKYLINDSNVIFKVHILDADECYYFDDLAKARGCAGFLSSLALGGYAERVLLTGMQQLPEGAELYDPSRDDYISP